MKDDVKITIIATGFSAQKEKPKMSATVPVAVPVRPPARALSEPAPVARPLVKRSPSRELRPEAPLSNLQGNTGLPPPGPRGAVRDIPAFLRRKVPPKGRK